MPTALHIAPHPDDELLGAGGTLLRLCDSGWTVVNLACSLGRPSDTVRRTVELTTACARAGFMLRTTAAPIAISSADDLALAQQALTEEIGAAIADVQPQLVVGPSPHDAHHGHEVVGRATYAALARLGRRPRWWIWTLWGYAPTPSLFVEFDVSVLTRLQEALEAHRGELARADYGRALLARSALAAVLGVEQVYGWGSVGGQAAYAEVLTELLTDRFEGWSLARPRRPEFPAVLSGGMPRGCDLDHWLRAPGPRTALIGPQAMP